MRFLFSWLRSDLRASFSLGFLLLLLALSLASVFGPLVGR